MRTRTATAKTPTPISPTTEPESYLVDVTGKHCYEAGDVAYGQGLTFAPKRLTKMRVYALQANYWFERPDDTVNGPASQKGVTLRQVARCGESR
jgi:hypothetical protein